MAWQRGCAHGGSSPPPREHALWGISVPRAVSLVECPGVGGREAQLVTLSPGSWPLGAENPVWGCLEAMSGVTWRGLSVAGRIWSDCMLNPQPSVNSEKI